MVDPKSGDTAARAPTTGSNEFQVISALRARFESAAGGGAPDGQVWIGDDAAVVGDSAGRPLLLATDLVVAGVHVDLEWCSLADLGFKAVMVAVSDIAAMGGRPIHLLVSVAAPPGTDFDLLGSGVADAASAAGCVVVGGDLSTASQVVVSVAVTGTLDAGHDDQPQPTAGHDDRPQPTAGHDDRLEQHGVLLRSGARVGDRLFVTGPLGTSAAGLRLLQAGGPLADRGANAELVHSHRRPVARVAEGEVARLAGATAAIDISDGLAADVRHLAEASSVGIALDSVPVAEGATEDEALGGGEEYELILATGDPNGLITAFEASGLRPPIAIGVCTADPEERTLGGKSLATAGWQHHFD